MEEQAGGKITAEDVQTAVEQLGGDPNATNAARIREILGRGSYATIQKHLNALRTALTEPEPIDAEAIPEAPQEILAGIWAAAWSAAAQRYGAKLLAVTERADDLAERLATATDDLDELLVDLDRVQTERDEAVQMAGKAEQILAIDHQAIAQERAGIEAEREALAVMMAQLRGVLTHSSSG